MMRKEMRRNKSDGCECVNDSLQRTDLTRAVLTYIIYVRNKTYMFNRSVEACKYFLRDTQYM